METINRIKASLVEGDTYEINLYSGTGPSQSSSQLLYNPSNLTIDWNQSGINPNVTNIGSVQVDFSQYNSTEICDVLVIDGAAAGVKGGIVLNSTGFPPKPASSHFDELKSGTYLNETESNAFKLADFDLKENANQTWDLNMAFNPTGTNYYQLDAASMVYVDGSDVLQILVSPTGSATSLNVNLNSFNYPVGPSVPFIITASALVSNVEYLKKGVMQIE